jgi:hypothetical protein
MFNNFEFFQANFIRMDSNPIYSFFFTYEDEFLFLIIEKAYDMHIERDEDGYYEEYFIGNIEFTVFTNMENYRAIWLKDGYVYLFSTFMQDLQGFKALLDNLY